MNRASLYTLLAVGVCIAGLVALFLGTSTNKFGEKPRSLAELGGDFTLSSINGDVSLSDHQGKVVVMYFGFLSCPEVCPASLGVIQTAFNRLPAEQVEQTQAILVSVDPKRDTLKELEEYAEFYHPNLVGVTGTVEQIDSVTQQYGAYYNYSDIAKANADYGVEHSSRYYVIDQTGRLVAAMRHSTTPNELVAQIQELL